MNVKQLRFFLGVAECESFTKAAEKLHIAQPALSIAIKKLEEELEVLLFNRRDRKITLTAEGEALLLHAQSILQGVCTKCFQQPLLRIRKRWQKAQLPFMLDKSPCGSIYEVLKPLQQVNQQFSAITVPEYCL